MTWLQCLSAVVLAFYGAGCAILVAAFLTACGLVRSVAKAGGDGALDFLSNNLETRAPKWVTKLVGSWLVQFLLKKAEQVVRNETALKIRLGASGGIGLALLLCYLAVKYAELRVDAAFICLLVPAAAIFLGVWSIGLAVVSKVSDFVKAKMPELLKTAGKAAETPA